MDLTLHSLVNTKDLKILIRTEVQLLDEATSHLDLATEVNAALQRLHITRIVLAHRPETGQHAANHRSVNTQGIRRPDACRTKSFAARPWRAAQRGAV